VEHFKFEIENELVLLEKYRMTPTELFTVRVILLAKINGEYEWLQRFAQILKLRDILESLQTKGIIIKNWKFPKEGEHLVIEDIPFNQNFQKQFFRAANEMGWELYNAYPSNCFVDGQYFNLRTVSKKFGSIEQAFLKYSKYIKNNPETHQHIIELIEWGKENNYAFPTMDRFIVDLGWKALEEFKDHNVLNINNDAIKMI